jgi:hypothetical protein
MSAVSYSPSENHVFQLPLFDPNKMASSAGGYPWKADGDYATVLYIKNETNQPQRYVANLTYAGGKYFVGAKTIKAKQTVAIDFRQLRDSQTADANGHLIPTNLENGQITWSVFNGENKTLSGRSEQINLSQGLSSTYDCRNCCPDSTIIDGVIPGTGEAEVGGTINYLLNTHIESCYGNSGTFPSEGYGWLSTDSSIAIIADNGLAEAMSPGEAFFTVDWTSRYWFMRQIDLDCQFEDTPGSGIGEMLSKPKINDIDPERSVVNREVNVTIDGRGFVAGATVQVSGSGITVSDVNVQSQTRITAKFTIASNATQGERNVTVTANSQTSNSKKFRAQVPHQLVVVADTGNVPFANCPYVISRQVTYKLQDSENKDIRQAVNVKESFSGQTTNSCQNGQPNPSACAPTTASTNQYYQFTDGIAITGNCASQTALQNCRRNGSCGYEHTQNWNTCSINNGTNDGNIQLAAIMGITHCNEIRLNNTLQFNVGEVVH